LPIEQIMILNKIKQSVFFQKINTKKRLVVLDEENFEELFSLQLTYMNVFVVASIGAILLITLTTLLISFTSLKEYIPGYASASNTRETMNLVLKTDSLSQVIQGHEAYLNSLQKMLKGDLEFAKFNKDSILPKFESTEKLNVNPTAEELELRKKVKEQEAIFQTNAKNKTSKK
jgi:hypothetical protein